jgi:hypothetical protein
MKKEINTIYWLSFVILIFAVKFLFFCIDPLPMFYIGDSLSYISTAVSGWIPMDRSFLYGFVVRLIAVSAHSLTSLIAVQVFISGLNAILLAYVLRKFFAVTPITAYVLGLFCAVEPLELMYERYVMTESFALFIFVIYLTFVFHYLRKPSLFYMVLVQITGVLLIAFRLSFLPVVIINAVILPFLAAPVLVPQYSFYRQQAGNFWSRSVFSGTSLRIVALHVLFSIVCTYSLHLGYMYLNGHLSKKPPAYQYQTGVFLLAYWAPLVKPVDFPRPDLLENVFDGLQYKLEDRHRRAEQHWQPGGIISNLAEAVPDVLEAERIAKKTAFNAVKRDPLGILALGMSGFLDYWNLEILRCNMQGDRGDRPLPPEMLELLENKFSISGERLPFLITMTNSYFLSAWPWYLFLICTPFIAAGFLFVSDRKIRKNIFIVLVASSIIVVNASVLIEGPTVRYIHSLGWLNFLTIGPLVVWVRMKLRPIK